MSIEQVTIDPDKADALLGKNLDPMNPPKNPAPMAILRQQVRKASR
jgi:hypothetical protein